MTPASMYTIVTMPKQYKDDALLHRYVDKYKELRLRSLKSDPDSFSSTLASESKQLFEFWTGRMMNPRAQHFVAVQLNENSSVASIADDPHAILETEWVGTLVVLGGKAVAIDDQSPWKSLARGRFMEDGVTANSDSIRLAYHLAGFYVAPESRGQGLGGSLVQKGMEMIAHENQTTHISGAICTVGVSHRNLVVRRLFKRVGFVEIAEEEHNTEDGRHLTEIVLRRDIPL